MTALQTRPRVLTGSDGPELRRLVHQDRITNCVLDSRIEYSPGLDARRLGGFIWGLDSGTEIDAAAAVHYLRAALFHGGNLIPVGDDRSALETLADQLSRSGRGCSSIVGPASSVQAIWPVLSRRWGPARAVRASQPLLVIDRPADAEFDPTVRVVRPSEIERFMPAAIAMFTEELEISPMGRDGGASYRARVAEVIGTGRAFARFDDRGQVEFKAEIGALSCGTAQVQGVWVRPDLRGRGLGTAAMAAVLRLALDRAPTVSLYVNDFNVTARNMYDRLGMVEIGTLSTVLF
ncbi:GNAT family N-acetyltransferase [Jatrophihabitans sp. DSM 45814]